MIWIARVKLLAATFLWASASALAGPITYVLSTTLSGTIGDTVVTNASSTITSTADTGNIFVVQGSVYEVLAGSSTLSIAGLAVATFTDPMFWADPQGSGDIIFGDSKLGLAEELGFDNPISSLTSYQLQTDFGPLASSSDFTSFVGPFKNIPTSEGLLDVSASNDTFSATLNPQSLNGIEGGTTANPTLLPIGPKIDSIEGSIGAFGTQQYYSFFWAGGTFTTNASVPDAPSPDAAYLFSLGAIGNCSGLASATLNSGDLFSSTIGVANLAPGDYCVGLSATDLSDPPFDITFDTPVSGDAPEPQTACLSFIGLMGLTVSSILVGSRSTTYKR